jgi:uncharacterized protein (TIGR02246 family)
MMRTRGRNLSRRAVLPAPRRCQALFDVINPRGSEVGDDPEQGGRMVSVRKPGVLGLLALAALVLTISPLAPAAIHESEQANHEDARRAITAVLQAHQENWNRHNMTAWADAVLHEDSDWVNWRGGYWRGKAAIRAGHEAIHKAQYKSSRLSAQRIEDLTFIAPDIAIAHVRSELSGDERAPGQTFPYRKTILFTKQQDVWRIRALHNTRLLDLERP